MWAGSDELGEVGGGGGGGEVGGGGGRETPSQLRELLKTEREQKVKCVELHLYVQYASHSIGHLNEQDTFSLSHNSTFGQFCNL